jgi:uncharacterized RDD family membrane protein YckC
MFGIGKKKEKLEAPSVAAAATMAELQPAGFWLRLVAVVVDSALMMILLGVMMIGAAGVSEDLVAPAYWLWVLISFLYWPVLESTARRGTVGKMMLGLVVADIDGGRLPFLRSLLRNLAKIISAIPFYIGFLLTAFTARKQALHDLITKAVVLRQAGSGFARAAAVLVVGIALFVAGGYFAADYLMDMVPKEMQAMMGGETPMPAKPPVMAKATAKPAPAPVAEPAPAPAAPQPVAQSPAPAPAPVAAAPAPVAQPAPIAPTAAPAPVAKPAAAPAPAKPAPVKVAAAPKPPAMQEPEPAPPAPVQSTRPRADPPQQQSRPVAAPASPLISPRFNDVMTAVLYRDRETVSQLLDFGRWADKRDSNGFTPLMIAALTGDSAMARLLLERGADPDLQAPGGATALEFAQQSGDAATTQLLQRSAAR